MAEAKLRKSQENSVPKSIDENELNVCLDCLRSLLPIDFQPREKKSSPVEELNEFVERMSTHLGTLSIVQQEFDSMKEILSEKEKEIEKLRVHCEQIRCEMIFRPDRRSSFSDSDDEEIRRELRRVAPFEERTSSQQSLSSTTPGEKEQLIGQNEILSNLINEQQREIASMQQNEKIRLEQMEERIRTTEEDRSRQEDQLKQIKNILDEKIRENSALKREKILLIERIDQIESDRRENVTANDAPRKDSAQIELELVKLENLLEQKSLAFVRSQNELNLFQNLFQQEKEKNKLFDENQRLLGQREQQIDRQNEEINNFAQRIRQLEENLSEAERRARNSDRVDEIQLELRKSVEQRNLAIVEKKQMERRIEQLNEEVCFVSTERTRPIERCFSLSVSSFGKRTANSSRANFRRRETRSARENRDDRPSDQREK